MHRHRHAHTHACTHTHTYANTRAHTHRRDNKTAHAGLHIFNISIENQLKITMFQKGHVFNGDWCVVIKMKVCTLECCHRPLRYPHHISGDYYWSGYFRNWYSSPHLGNKVKYLSRELIYRKNAVLKLIFRLIPSSSLVLYCK